MSKILATIIASSVVQAENTIMQKTITGDLYAFTSDPSKWIANMCEYKINPFYGYEGR